MPKLKVRIEPVDRAIKLALDETAGPQARSKAIATFARRALKESQDHNARILGYVPDHETYVDGRRGAVEESVKPDGRIVYEFDLLNDIFAWIGEQLVKMAPVGTSGDRRPGHPGAFRNSFLFFADDALVEPSASLPEANEYTFISPLPYARKLERGYSDQAPDGVFEVVAKAARSRYKGQATIRFTYRSMQGGGTELVQYKSKTTIAAKAISKGRSAGRAAQIAKGVADRERETRVPAIVIQLPRK